VFTGEQAALEKALSSFASPVRIQKTERQTKKLRQAKPKQ
jgi:hypothetical protein